MVSTDCTPWIVGRKDAASRPCASAQRDQIRSAEAIELMIVPSMSNRSAARGRDGRADSGMGEG